MCERAHTFVCVCMCACGRERVSHATGYVKGWPTFPASWKISWNSRVARTVHVCVCVWGRGKLQPASPWCFCFGAHRMFRFLGEGSGLLVFGETHSIRRPVFPSTVLPPFCSLGVRVFMLVMLRIWEKLHPASQPARTAIRLSALVCSLSCSAGQDARHP